MALTALTCAESAVSQRPANVPPAGANAARPNAQRGRYRRNMRWILSIQWMKRCYWRALRPWTFWTESRTSSLSELLDLLRKAGDLFPQFLDLSTMAPVVCVDFFGFALFHSSGIP